jgi:hypothetical protein
VAVLLTAGSAAARIAERDGLLAVADVPSPAAPLPSPLKSPGAAPLLPPEGLPTAPPPDAIKPVEPRAVQPAPDPASASGRVPGARLVRDAGGV